MAWVGIICLLLLYVISFFLGISRNEAAFPMFIASLLATFFIPTMIYLFQLIMKNAREKRERYNEEFQEDMARDENSDGESERSGKELQ